MPSEDFFEGVLDDDDDGIDEDPVQKEAVCDGELDTLSSDHDSGGSDCGSGSEDMASDKEHGDEVPAAGCALDL